METYVSVDIEADGPIPADYSMLSIGLAAHSQEAQFLGALQVNLLPLEGARQDPDTMKFWGRNPEAWIRLQQDRYSPAEGMALVEYWLRSFHRPVFVGYPASFDFMFYHWYMVHFLGKDPLGFQALDIKTYAMSVLGTEFKGTTKRNMPSQWFRETKHTHVASEDALEQGILFGRMKTQRDRIFGALDGSPENV
jgi:hypothetical protein